MSTAIQTIAPVTHDLGDFKVPAVPNTVRYP